MAVTIVEKFDSRKIAVGTATAQDNIDLLYVAFGDENETTVLAAVRAFVPGSAYGRSIQNIEILHLGGGVWDVSARYGKWANVENFATQTAPSPSTFNSAFNTRRFRFSTKGGTQHINYSKSTTKYPAGAPESFHAINVTGDDVQGVDIAAPAFTWTETHNIPMSVLDQTSFIADVSALTTRVNNATFRGYAAGEVLFIGAEGGSRSNDDTEIEFEFSRSANRTSFAVGGITVTSAKGWEYVWVRWRDTVSGNHLMKQPVGVYVDKVLEEGNFAGLRIGT